MSYEGMIAETVLIKGHEGDMIDAYLARPLGAGPHGGVVLIHHMPGWDEASKEMARKLAYHGFATISPNLHFREGQATPQENSASIREKGGMPDVRTMGDVEGAMAYLQDVALPQRQGGADWLLLRRTPDLPGRLHPEGRGRRGELLGRRRDPG